MSLSIDQRNRHVVPVILIHTGNQKYFQICLETLVRVHGYDVVVIGDATNAESTIKAGGRHFLLERYSKYIINGLPFEYLHDSYLPAPFERFCFERFIALLNFITEKRLDRFVYLDSDILILNRSIMDAVIGSTYSNGFSGLSDVSTFFCGWDRSTFSKFVESFPGYFDDQAWGDRHCDMFALKRFLSTNPNIKSFRDLIDTIPAYSAPFYVKDPNFSFAPMIMKFSKIWGYDEIAHKKPPIRDMIFKHNGVFYIYYPDVGYMIRNDFVHLNGFTKFYIDEFEIIMRAAETEDDHPLVANASR